MDTKSVFYLIQLFEGLGMGSFFPIYTPWLEAHGLNFFKMGTVNFFYHISASTLDPFTGFIADKFGKRKTFISGQILWTAMLYIYGASTQIVGFILAEGIAAVGGSLKSDTLESWLQNKLGKLEASRVMGRAKILFTIGQIIASIASGYLSATLGMKLMWFISGTCMLTATILSSITLAKAGGDVSTNTTERNNIADVNIKKIFTLTATNRKIVSTALIVAAFSFASKPVFMYWPQIVSRLGMADTLRGWVILSVAIPAMIGGLLAGHGVFFTHNKAV